MLVQPDYIKKIMQKFAQDNKGEIDDPVFPCMCITNRLEKPKIIATATDRYLKPKVYINDLDLLSHLSLGENLSEVERESTCFSDSYLFGYGQDLDHYECQASVPKGTTPASLNESKLRDKMLLLLDEFASCDSTGMSKRLFDRFLQKKSSVEYFEDSDLNSSAEKHNNIQVFCDRVMSVPGFNNISSGKVRVHQALQAKDWDINKVDRLTDLGVPAFNEDNLWGKDDWNNGL